MKHSKISHPSIFTSFTSVIAALCVALFSMFLTVAPQQDPFQAPFDFDQFLSELEGALAKIEEEEKAKNTGGQPSRTLEDKGAPIGTPGPLVTKIATGSKLSDEKRDPASLFLDPALQELTPKGGQKMLGLTKESLNAYNTIMDDFTYHLGSIKNKIGNTQRFSPSFKEEFSLFYKHLIDTIVIAHQQIKSKKAYRRLFLSPPEAAKQLVTDMKKLRQMILDTAKKIKRLDEQLMIKAHDEEVESTEELLRKLAGQYQDTELPPVTPVIIPRTRTRSYTPTKKQQPVNPIPKIVDVEKTRSADAE